MAANEARGLPNRAGAMRSDESPSGAVVRHQVEQVVDDDDSDLGFYSIELVQESDQLWSSDIAMLPLEVARSKTPWGALHRLARAMKREHFRRQKRAA